MDRRKSIGTRIKAMRLSRGMSQNDLADALHCGQSTVAMYETGKRMPDIDTVDMLADIFNVPPYAITYSESEIAEMIGNPADDDLMQLREDMRRNPQLRVLYDLQRKATKSELKQMEAFIKAIRSTGDDTENDDPA